jgi:hypothetical protein
VAVRKRLALAAFVEFFECIGARGVEQAAARDAPLPPATTSDFAIRPKGPRSCPGLRVPGWPRRRRLSPG